jgi:hypothetical protein
VRVHAENDEENARVEEVRLDGAKIENVTMADDHEGIVYQYVPAGATLILEMAGGLRQGFTTVEPTSILRRGRVEIILRTPEAQS